MPKFLVTSGSYFEPFTYDELAKPIMQAAEAHSATQDAYDQLALDTASLGKYITNNPGDVKAKKMYDDYMSQLNAFQDNLWKNGFTPSARRSLSAARAGYASDIKRIESAIKTRQERSAKYWDIKHNHPDMIMSSDPGTAGLDNYLENDNYGQDYYSYGGEQFMNEVAADAKARANEIINDPEILNKYPQLAGYIPLLKKNGFTSMQVEAAAFAVQQAYEGNTKALEQLDPSTMILASVLTSHLESTGARGKVDKSEFERLIQYGKFGLSQAIGKQDIDFMKDNEYEYRQRIREAREKSNIEVEEYRRKKEIDDEREANKAAREAEDHYGFTNTGETIRMESPLYRDWVKSTRREAKGYEGGQTRTIQSPDGNSSRTVRNEYEMATYLYETNARAMIRRGYGGYDVAFDPNGEEKRTVRLKDGTTQNVTISKMDFADATRLGLNPDTAVAVKDANGKIHEGASTQISIAREEYLDHVEKLKAANPDIEKYAISPKKQKELRKEYGYPETAPWSDFYSYMLTTASFGDESAVVIANDSSHDYVKSNLARAIIREYNSNSSEDHGKTSRFAFYEVTDGNTGHKKEGITDIRAIFGTKNGGTELRDDTLTNVSATLKDLASERPMVRIQTSVNPGKTFLIDADMLGPLFANNYTNIIPETRMSNSDMIDYIMLPILHPDAVYEMPKAKADEWRMDCYKILGGDFPTVIRADGTKEPATPREIVRDKEFQEWLKYSVMQHIANPSAQRIRQVIGQEHEQNIGNQSTKPEPIL